jgi:hypothetical protein
MTDWPAVPNFGAVLATHINAVPDEGQPAFLAGLERSAAARYRSWAEALPDHAEVLNACAAREDEIADRVAGLFPVSAETQSALDAALPAAIQTYYEVFSEYAVLEQLYLQSEAELQGSQAWVGIASQIEDEGTREILARCTALEVESSQAVKALLEKIA